MSMKGESAMPMPQALQDTQRVNFCRDYVAAATDAVNLDKVPLILAFTKWHFVLKLRISMTHACIILLRSSFLAAKALLAARNTDAQPFAAKGGHLQALKFACHGNVSMHGAVCLTVSLIW
jgi:hypothetical protein